MKQVWYDIFKGKPDATELWLESSLTDLQRATEQMNYIAARTPGDYFIVEPATGKVVASVERNTASPICSLQVGTKFVNLHARQP
jgi:hypothetical protein